MAINIKNQIFTLHTKNSTYQMKVDEQNMLIHTYYGNRTDDTAICFSTAEQAWARPSFLPVLQEPWQTVDSAEISRGLTESVYILWIFFRRSFRYMATEIIV